MDLHHTGIPVWHARVTQANRAEVRTPWRCHLDAKTSSQNAPVATVWLLRHVWLLNTIETQHGFLLVYTCLAFFLINIFSPFQFFQKHNGFTTKCRVPVLKNPPWDSVISLQTAWPWKVPFSTKFLSSSMGPSIFFYKVTWHPKLKWAVDLFTRWPHYKMTHKNPFCSGLKATHFVWEIRRRMFTVSYNYNLPFMFLGLRNICRFGPLLKPPHLLTSAEKTLYRGQINLL